MEARRMARLWPKHSKQLLLSCVFLQLVIPSVAICNEFPSIYTELSSAAVAACGSSVSNTVSGYFHSSVLKYGVTSVTSTQACCAQCSNDPFCRYWSLDTVNMKCILYDMTACTASPNLFYSFNKNKFVTGVGTGTGVSGTKDPHFEFIALDHDANMTVNFNFDFHGEAGKFYCMVTDSRLQLNVRMFGLGPHSKIIEDLSTQPDPDPLFLGTWMDALGIVYLDPYGEQRDLAVVLDPEKGSQEGLPLVVSFQGHILDLQKAPWTSSDGFASVAIVSDQHGSRIIVKVADLVNLEVEVNYETELIAEPPVRFLTVNIRSLLAGTDVHGFLGQMFRPGAVEERLAMGTLEGLRHREYIEGLDQDYATTELSTFDCSFSRFGKLYVDSLADNGVSALEAGSHDVKRRKLLSGSGSNLKQSSWSAIATRNGFVLV